MNAYRYLAKVYDSLMSDVDYNNWARYLHGFLSKAGAKRVLEVSCGTGNITFELSALGYDIIASDLSVQMLKVAKQRNTQLCADVKFVRQDMRKIEVGNKVDALVCACDGVNYIDSAGFVQFAKSAYSALRQGGMLLFDISSQYKLKNVMDGQVYFDERDELACIWKNTFDESLNALTLDVTLFVKNADMYEKLHETHTQYAHSAQSLQNCLEQVGFAQIDVYDAFTHNAPQPSSQRLQFVCYKI